jgi:SAM-dependent methyltransferase
MVAAMWARLADIVARWRRGEVSAEIGLLQLLIAAEDVDDVRAAVEDAPALAQLLADNELGCERICVMLASDVDSDEPAASVDEGLAFTRRLFDWAVRRDEEISVAMYSFGNPAILARATDEVVALLDRWGVLTPTTRALELGCGIGRLLPPIAARTAHVIGIDLAPGMVEVARRRCPGIEIRGCSGRDLADHPDGSLDLVYAVDSFPYIVQSGAALVVALFAEIARVLAPGGHFALLAYSYRHDDAADRAEVAAYARDAGLEVVVAGEHPFALWDALAFLIQRNQPVASDATATTGTSEIAHPRT